MSHSDSPHMRTTVPAIVIIGLLGAVLWATVYSPGNEKSPTAAAGYVQPPDNGQVENGKDVTTGFIAEGDYKIVKATCTACHSSSLVLQNRATREGWESMIRWMQANQKLWDLGVNEDKILDYLATYYGPSENAGRRQNLVVEEWYPIGN